MQIPVYTRFCRTVISKCLWWLFPVSYITSVWGVPPAKEHQEAGTNSSKNVLMAQVWYELGAVPFSTSYNYLFRL